MRCPLCHTLLPDGSQACTRCDWVRPSAPRTHTRDWIAVLLSLAIPGLGQIYKGHVIMGGLIFFIVGPAVLALSLAVLPATLGLSLVIPALLLGGVAFHAYYARDRREEIIERARAFERAHPAH